MNARRVLMIAFHYPPLLGSSGWLRTAAFARYLPDFGWRPRVLSAHPRAYATVSDEHLAAVAGIPVVRAFALDTARHLAVAGRYPLLLALPDRWVAWLPGALAAGLRIVRRERPAVLWSTFPIPTAVLAGLILQRLTRLPWVLDLRDAMLDPDFPETRAERRVYAWLERAAVGRAAAVVVTTPGAARLYRARYPELPPEHFQVLPNGYDEAVFRRLAPARSAPLVQRSGRLRLVHSGLLSAVDRNPDCFFQALAELKRSGRLPAGLQVVLRGSGEEAGYLARLHALGIGDLVELAAPVSYDDALQEMLAADGLLLFQGSTCNHAIPAKVFEYLRAQRPILALTDPAGDTAALLRQLGTGRIVRLDSAQEIAAALPAFCDEIRNGRYPLPDPAAVQRYSRAALTAGLAEIFDAVSG